MLAAFLLGFFGSLHCVGMCGPLAIVIHQQANRKAQQPAIAAVLYHLGRITTYVLLGLVIGSLSMALWGNLQFYLSVIAGLILILAAFSLLPWERQIWSLPGLKQLGEWIPKAYGRFLNSPSRWAPVAGGMVNGLLPCGLVYLALSTSMATGDVLLGARMMLLFGLGTAPALAVTQFAGWKIKGRFAMVRTYVLPPFLVLTGLFLILRAFAVPIPVGLRLLHEMTNIPMCH